MTLRENTPTGARPTDAAANGRLETLAAIWARQTGRPIVVSAVPAPNARRVAARSNA